VLRRVRRWRRAQIGSHIPQINCVVNSSRRLPAARRPPNNCAVARPARPGQGTCLWRHVMTSRADDDVDDDVGNGAATTW